MSQSSFLSQIAENILRDYPELEKITLIFPNRRAGLFLRKALSQQIDKAVWSPNVISIDDFIQNISPLKSQDPLALNFELFHVFQEVMYGTNPEAQQESFDQFYFWGQMLLKDFEDLDKYMVESEHLLKNVAELKAIDQQFDYLSEEEKALVTQFWSSFKDKNLQQAEQFQELWEKLPTIHRAFQQRLREKGMGYSGMIHQSVLEIIKQDDFSHQYGTIIFAGFNALTTTEQRIISHFVEKEDAKIYWDLDRYYYEDYAQEAGRFLREYRQDPILGKTLPPIYSPSDNNPYPDRAPDHFIAQKKEEEFPVEIIGVPLEVGQTKLTGDILSEIKAKILARGETFEEEKTAVIIPQEHMLFSVLHSVPEDFKSLNVTMGYPLRNTALYTFFELVCRLQQGATEGPLFPYKVALELLDHPYLSQSVAEDAQEKILELKKAIIHRNQSLVPLFLFQEMQLPIFDALFYKAPDVAHFSEYLTKLLLFINKSVLTEEFEDAAPEQEFVLKLYKELKKLEDLMATHTMNLQMETFIRLLRQVVQGVRVPFSGEPLLGLQIMGVLETRNLDFDQVIIMSMNEGAFPQAASKNSFIPYNLRKAFHLPTFEQHDAMYAYLFYRLAQRCKKMYMIHNTETDGNYKGEESRYLYQLRFESPFKLKEKVLALEPKVKQAEAIAIEKKGQVMEILKERYITKEYPLSPSAINTFLDCPLRFYFRYIAQLKEREELKEELDMAATGTILHNALEALYKGLMTRTNSNTIMPKQIKEELMKSLPFEIEKGIREHYKINSDQHLKLAGNNVIVNEMLNKMGEKILETDIAYAPFEIVGLEMGRNKFIKVPFQYEGKKYDMKISGSIDRVDLKGKQLRILDYKTGKDDTSFPAVEDLFDRKKNKRSKVALQTLLYSMLYDHNYPDTNHEIVPAVYAIREMFSNNFDYHLKLKKTRIKDARPMMPEVMNHMQLLMNELFNSEIPFYQTEDEHKCTYCDFKQICRRG